MVRIKSYKCAHCDDTDTTNIHHICYDCGLLFCYACNRKIKQEIISKCVVTKTNCSFVFFDEDPIIYLKECAPEDELKLLNFGKWNPFFCEECGCPFTMKRRLARVESVALLCVNCVPPGAALTVRDDHTLVKIMGELKGYFTNADEECDVSRTGIQLENWKCGKCKKNDSYLYCSNGDILCLDCVLVVCYANWWDQFVNFLVYIPNMEDLKLLTYSKWTPLKCGRCSVVLSEKANQFPTHHQCCEELVCKSCSANYKCCESTEIFPVRALVDVIKEFRALFKNNGLDPHQEQWPGPSNGDKQKIVEPCSTEVSSKCKTHESYCHSSSKTERLKVLLPETTSRLSNDKCPEEFPHALTFSCIDCEERENVHKMLNCLTCAKYGICALCVTKRHWGHTISDTKKEMLRVSFQNKSEKTLAILNRWKADVDNMQAQGFSAQAKLCESYRQLFTRALQCDKAEILQSINEEVNVIQLQTSVKDYLTSSIRLNSSVNVLADKIAGLLEELNENNVGSKRVD